MRPADELPQDFLVPAMNTIKDAYGQPGILEGKTDERMGMDHSNKRRCPVIR